MLSKLPAKITDLAGLVLGFSASKLEFVSDLELRI